MDTTDLVNLYTQLSVAAPLGVLAVLIVIGCILWQEVNRW